MIVNILKKDLKRKKTTNIILFIFMVLASMFIVSSVLNITAMTNSLDSFFEKANVADYLVIFSDGENEEMEAFLEHDDELVENFNSSNAINVKSGSLKDKDDEDLNEGMAVWLTTCGFMEQVIFDQDNKPITAIKEGEIYLANKFLSNYNLEVGETIYFEEEDYSKEFVIGGFYKDAYFGTTMMSMDRIVISQRDYDEMKENVDFTSNEIYTISTDNIEEFTKSFGKSEVDGIFFQGDRALIENTYLLDMVIAMILLAASVCFILIALIIVKFSIGFTLSQEFSEIGIMKAIGVTNRRIRSIYIIKYLAISIVGSLIGFGLSIPFGNMLLEQVAKTMVLEAGDIGFIIGFLAMIVLVLIVQLFCYHSTKAIVKLSPVQAISNGKSGERFSKKGVLRLHKSRFHPSAFMAINDILSSPKRFSSLILIFVMGTILINIPATAASTLSSDGMIAQQGLYPADLMVLNGNGVSEAVADNRFEEYEDEEMELLGELTSEYGHKADMSTTLMMTNRATYKDISISHVIFQHRNLSLDSFDYLEGTVPQDIDEIAITNYTADELGVVIGDTITIDFGAGEEEFIITAYFQTMTNMGQGIRIHEDVAIPNIALYIFVVQMSFEEGISKKEIAEMQVKFQEELPDYVIQTGSESMSTMTGGAPETVGQVGYMIFAIVLLINILITVLIVTSFIMKETGEIAILKAIGFKNKKIIKWQTLRIGIILIGSIILGSLLSIPVNRVIVGEIFKMMGLAHVEFTVNYIQLYFIYPIILIVTTVFASYLSSRQIVKINTNEINSVE